MSDDKTIIADQSVDTITNIPSRSSPVLIQYDGGTPGKKFPLTGKMVILGRSNKAQVWVDDKSVSREHCRIEWEEGKALVTDLGSTNHSYINDRKVEQTAELAHGDMLRVGNIRLRYFAHGNEDQLLFDRIYRMAVQDSMLEIFRREYLLEKLEEEIRLARSQGHDICFIMFDLDKFKAVNDNYGHDAGDLVLKEVAHLVKSKIQPDWVLGRYGGEEFGIVLPLLTLEESAEFAEDLRRSVELLDIEYNNTEIPITISMGIACLTPEMKNYLDLIKAADVLLYKSKENGRNRVTLPN